MKYTVTPVAETGCDCPDCQAGRHLYELHHWRDGQWQFVGVSLQTYGSAQDCKQHHYWGIEFQVDDVWEDGTAILPPQWTERPKSSTERKVTLDLDAFQKSAGALNRHWLTRKATGRLGA